MEIVVGLAVVGLTVVLVVKEIIHYKERVTMAKINKTKDVREMEYVFAGDKKQEESGIQAEEEYKEITDISHEDIIEHNKTLEGK